MTKEDEKLSDTKEFNYTCRRCKEKKKGAPTAVTLFIGNELFTCPQCFYSKIKKNKTID